ncbi:crotonobetaine/carnitine-CoA ligase [Thermocatellispora tengchongensis]|uniref:Crotonobetaine/carnitine-CoA ligase n=1 Tax=Thermocatellispora tengchongensis TaxID=1073253 RepID=A0A840PR34_9ACTN|nr:AMP-binding protein [Thermocatellispora tengchongensis]MBB5138435.1 crotonobetaine/carnitine-CoA ligase [Thermocatellispora tengchongensis]
MGEWGTASTEGLTAVGLLRDCAEEAGDRPFLDFGGEWYTYRQLWRRATSYAAGLRKAGLQPDQTVVTMLDNNVDAVSLWFAANLPGGIWVPINTALKGGFLSHVVADAGARVVVCEADFVDRFRAEIDRMPNVERILVRGLDVADRIGDVAVEPLADYLLDGGDQIWADRGSDDTALIIYTGGTTGPSKGCVISNGYVFSSARGFLVQSGRTEDELNWSPLPIYHFNLVSGTILGTMLLRGSASIAPRFSVSGFWPDIERTGAAMVNLLGSMGSLIAQMDETPEMTRCHGRIRVVHGAPFPPELQEVWRTRFGVRRVGGNTYGLTECFPLTTLEVGAWSPPGSSGKANAADFDVRIFDDDDREVPVGEVGEVVCRPRRPDVMFQGYWRRPEAFAAVTRNLWFHTGDLGRFDEDGFFYFVDRKKDYLRRRGENISSQEVEQAMLAHPALAEVAVHAVPSEHTEDDLKVTAVLVPGAGLSERELFEWAKDRIPYFALPRYIEFRDALPTSPLGRVHKYRLRDEGCTPATWDREKAGVQWDRR